MHGTAAEDLRVNALQNFRRLSLNPYPGRGIVVGVDESNRHVLQIYWLMGRSENSQNRILTVQEGVVKAAPFDSSKVEDPTLIIYSAARSVGDAHIISNGDHTDTVSMHIDRIPFEQILRTRQHEPDGPHWTPRITAMYDRRQKGESCRYSIITAADPTGKSSRYQFGDVSLENPGYGVCFHTYNGDGNPLPSFEGAPFVVPLSGGVDEIARRYWGILNEDKRVALAVIKISRLTGNREVTVINRHHC